MDNIDQFELNEMDVWEKFRQKYEHQFPTPERAQARLMQSVGAIILASLRTAEMFFSGVCQVKS